jgi:Secretion system C-terminal sorting domain
MLVYPNPIDKTVFVEVLNGENTEGSFEVYNALGILVKTQYFIKNQVRYELDLGELASGNYIVRIRQNDGQTATAKMTKM